MNGSADPDQLAFATRHGRVIYTSNARDFLPLHNAALEQGSTHLGMIVWSRSRRYGIGEQSRRILRVWNALSADDMLNRVEFLSHWAQR